MQRADMHKTSHFSTNNVHLKRYTYVVFLFLGFGIVVAFPIQTVQFTMEMQSQCVPDSGETRLHHSFLSMIFFEALSERVFVGFTEPMFPLGHWASWILHLIFKVYIYIYLYTYILQYAPFNPWQWLWPFFLILTNGSTECAPSQYPINGWNGHIIRFLANMCSVYKHVGFMNHTLQTKNLSRRSDRKFRFQPSQQTIL